MWYYEFYVLYVVKNIEAPHSHPHSLSLLNSQSCHQFIIYLLKQMKGFVSSPAFKFH
jgi:hypothetical protein